MSLADAFVETDAKHKAQVMDDTWGHMEAQPGTTHNGRIMFTVTEWNETIAISANFSTMPGSGPLFYHSLNDYISNIADRLSLEEGGVYLFRGRYVRYKNGNDKFSGVVSKVITSAHAAIPYRSTVRRAKKGR